MNTERQNGECGRHRDELLRMMCGDVREPSAAAQAHLVACAECREMVRASEGLLRALGQALAPEAVPETFRARVQRDLGMLGPVASAPARRFAPLFAGLGTAAVAACFIVAVFFPRGPESRVSSPADGTAAEIALSEDDATAIAAAYATLRWDDPAEYTLGVLTERAEEMAKSVEGKSETHSQWLWGTDDNWDMPSSKLESSVNAIEREVCASGTGIADMTRT